MASAYAQRPRGKLGDRGKGTPQRHRNRGVRYLIGEVENRDVLLV